jgi:FkbM family methyltransferase
MKEKKQLFKAKDHLVSGIDFTVWWIESKGFGYTELPEGTNLEAHYDAEEYISHKQKPHKFLDILYGTIRKFMLLYKYSIIKTIDKNKSILDIGAGVGSFALFVQKKGFDVIAIEPNAKAREICQKKGINTYESIKYISKNILFSVVSLWHVFEHLPDLKTSLRGFSKHLKSDGKLVIAVPNIKSHDACYYKSHWAALDVPRHLWHFSSKGLVDLVEEQGFVFASSHPLWFDSFYVSYLSEKHQGNNFSFIRGMAIGLYSNLKAFFNQEYSSKAYVFKKKLSSREI